MWAWALVVIGILAGARVKALWPGQYPGGLLITIPLGLAGSLFGGQFAKNFFRAYQIASPEIIGGLAYWLSLVIATAAALMLLVFYRLVTSCGQQS